MSSSAVRPVRGRAEESQAEIIDFDAALAPHCPRTRQSLSQHTQEELRHSLHRSIKGRKELATQRRGKPELSEAQIRALFSGHPSVTPDSFVGYKLTRRQRAQLKVLKKQYVGKPVELERRTQKDRTNCRSRHEQRHLRPVATETDELAEFMGGSTFHTWGDSSSRVAILLTT